MADEGRNGSSILLQLTIGGTLKTIAGQISGSHDLTVDTVDTTHKLSANAAKTFMATEHTATMSVDCQVDPNDSTNATYSDVYAAAKAKAAIAYSYGSATVGEKYYTGSAIITGVSQSAPKADKITFTLNLQVTGDETENTVS